MSRSPARRQPLRLTTHQVRALVLLFGLLAGVALVRYLWTGQGRPGDPRLTGAPRDLVFPSDAFRAADERGDGGPAR